MPDDNRFAGLSEAVEDDPDEESDAESTDESASGSDSSEDGGSTTVESEDEPQTEPETEDETDSSEPDSDSSAEMTGDEPTADETADDGSTDPDDPAAFPFDATEKKTVYVRPETLADLDDARALVDAQLRTDHDVRDLTGREFYDAVFRLAASDTEGVIDEILEAREE